MSRSYVLIGGPFHRQRRALENGERTFALAVPHPGAVPAFALHPSPADLTVDIAHYRRTRNPRVLLFEERGECKHMLRWDWFEMAIYHEDGFLWPKPDGFEVIAQCACGEARAMTVIYASHAVVKDGVKYMRHRAYENVAKDVLEKYGFNMALLGATE